MSDISAYRGPDDEPMATWDDVYRLMDDNRYCRVGGSWDNPDDHHAIAYLLSCLLNRNMDEARKAIELYERQVPGFAYDREDRWDWTRRTA